MPDLKDGESIEMQGSGKKPYIIKNTGGVYSCTCPAWRNQSTGVIRTCKHIRRLRGDAAEERRLGGELPAAPVKTVNKKVTAPPILLAEVWTPDVDPTGWLMSEKLDGVRAWWDGENFISRLGNIYHAPERFKRFLPKNMILDGELWLGRKQFQKCISIVRRQDAGGDWDAITYMIFDGPNIPGTFCQRYKALQEVFKVRSFGNTVLLPQDECKSEEDMQKRLREVERAGGEGLMLRDPQSQYEEGRSRTLLKVKSFQDDEAEVLSHEPGKGKHKGRLGALRVRNSAGVEFSVGTGLTDEQRKAPPAVGATIIYRYQELSTGGVPRFPSFAGVRDYE